MDDADAKPTTTTTVDPAADDVLVASTSREPTSSATTHQADPAAEKEPSPAVPHPKAEPVDSAAAARPDKNEPALTPAPAAIPRALSAEAEEAPSVADQVQTHEAAQALTTAAETEPALTVAETKPETAAEASDDPPSKGEDAEEDHAGKKADHSEGKEAEDAKADGASISSDATPAVPIADPAAVAPALADGQILAEDVATPKADPAKGNAALPRDSVDDTPALPSTISLATESLAGPSIAAAPSASTLSETLGLATLPVMSPDAVILGLAVVDFNHLVGPQVEYAHPNELLDDEDLVRSLPFLALPDGSHLSDEDFCYFHLNCPKLSPSTIFGISCNRQIASEALLKKGAEVTRSTVQKAVVVLAKEPVFGPIREKLGIVTRAFFAQGDLGDVDILVDFHATLEIGLQCGGLAEDRDTVMYMGTSIRELVHRWRFKTLMLVKLLLLQRRIMFFGYPVERLCTDQYSLVSLIPGLLLSLQDAAEPASKSQETRREKAESLRTSDRKSLMNYLGMPLNIFGEDAFFQPYCPLQQIDLLQSRSWLVGTSNSIFKQQKDCKIDVIVDLETSTLEFQDPRLQQLVGLTPADRKWMDEIVNIVNETWNAADPTRPTSMGYHGSDDFLRAKFEDYICAMLSSTRYADFLAKSDPEQVAIQAPDASSSHNFGTEYLAALRATNAFAIWQSTTDPMLFDIVDHKHPCDGKTSTIEDVGLRLSAGLHDLRLEENLAPTREAIGSAIQAGGANIYRLASNFRTDFAKFRATQLSGGINPMAILEGRNSSDKERAPTEAGGAMLAPPAKGTITGEAIDANGRRTTRSSLRPLSLVPGATLSATGGPVPATSSVTTGAGLKANEAMTAASQAAAQAGTQVRAALGSFGSFLSARQKAWTTSRTPSASSVTSQTSAPSEPRTSDASSAKP
ncbi:hypothetical protein ACQY0O_006926 [Thecaphora frezii]